MIYKEETLQQHIAVHRASIEMLDFQIEHLKDHRPALQVSLWRKNRAKLNKELQKLEAKYKTYYGTCKSVPSHNLNHNSHAKNSSAHR